RHLERFENLAARVHVNELTRLDAERWTVDTLTINHDVAVNDLLTGLRRRAGKAGTNDERVEAHLEKLDEVLTRQALRAAGFLEDNAKLSLTDAVLGPQTLLLAQTHRVVAVGLAASAAVLTRGVRTLLKVLGCLRSKGEAEGPREA